MKSTKIIYWTSTSILALMMTFSAFAYFTDPKIDAGFHQLGFPSYFRVELGIGKLLGAILLLAPVAGRVKEWMYAAFGIVFISAAIAHISIGDPAARIAGPLTFLAILIVSYIYYHKHILFTKSVSIR
jgi:uncharacterized membrane protein YphA (DoxX/SURF4 family)